MQKSASRRARRATLAGLLASTGSMSSKSSRSASISWTVYSADRAGSPHRNDGRPLKEAGGR